MGDIKPSPMTDRSLSRQALDILHVEVGRSLKKDYPGAGTDDRTPRPRTEKNLLEPGQSMPEDVTPSTRKEKLYFKPPPPSHVVMMSSNTYSSILAAGADCI